MLVCCSTIMEVKQNSIGIDFGNSKVYSGDLYECKICKKTIILANDSIIDDENYDCFNHYIKMNELIKQF